MHTLLSLSEDTKQQQQKSHQCQNWIRKTWNIVFFFWSKAECGKCYTKQFLDYISWANFPDFTQLSLHKIQGVLHTFVFTFVAIVPRIFLDFPKGNSVQWFVYSYCVLTIVLINWNHTKSFLRLHLDADPKMLPGSVQIPTQSLILDFSFIVCAAYPCLSVYCILAPTFI